MASVEGPPIGLLHYFGDHVFLTIVFFYLLFDMLLMFMAHYLSALRDSAIVLFLP